MKPYPKEFRQNKFEFKQVFRDGLFAIYRQTKPGTQIEAYEVVILREKPAEVFRGKPIPAREQYPAPEEWGERGWTYRNLPEAKEKLASLMLERNI